MANIKLIDESEAVELVVSIYNDIKKTFGMDFVPGMFRAMANNPAYLEASWNRYKAIMGPGKLDRKTKEIIAVAVSATNGCEYCINAHTAVLKKMMIKFSINGAGLGLRRELLPSLESGVPDVIKFFEVSPGNWIDIGGRLRNLRGKNALIAVH